jgi:hypothetical protein
MPEAERSHHPGLEGVHREQGTAGIVDATVNLLVRLLSTLYIDLAQVLKDGESRKVDIG